MGVSLLTGLLVLYLAIAVIPQWNIQSRNNLQPSKDCLDVLQSAGDWRDDSVKVDFELGILTQLFALALALVISNRLIGALIGIRDNDILSVGPLRFFLITLLPFFFAMIGIVGIQSPTESLYAKWVEKTVVPEVVSYQVPFEVELIENEPSARLLKMKSPDGTPISRVVSRTSLGDAHVATFFVHEPTGFILGFNPSD